jgi:hypothetical protein
MIYTGHATMRHVSHLQCPPLVTQQILEAIRSRFGQSILMEAVCAWPLRIDQLDPETKERIANIGCSLGA